MTATLELPPQTPQLRPNRPRTSQVPARLSPQAIVFLAVWLLLMVAGRERLFQDPGTFWHTAVGEQMLSSGAVVQRDSFTFTFAGKHWPAHQWLGECLMALAFRLGGWDTLLLVTSAVLAAMYAWLAHRWLQAGASASSIVGMLAMVFIASAHHYHVRPHLASIVLLAASFAILCDVDSGRSRLPRLGWLVPLFILWTNLHGGMLGGLATLALVIGGWNAAWLLGWRSPLASWRDVGVSLAVFAGCAASMFLSPLGTAMPRAWLTIMGMSLPDVIQEHSRLDVARPEAWMTFLAGIGYLTMVWRKVRRAAPQSDNPRCETFPLRVTWLVPIVWFLLACDRMRHAPLFAVVAAVAAAELLRRDLSPRIATARTGFALPAAVLALSFVLQIAGLPIPVVRARWARLDSNVWPTEMLDELRQLPSRGSTKVFNALHFGGFLALHTPELRTFIDDRCELFGDAFLRQYAKAEATQPEEIERWRQQYGFQHALVRAGTPFDSYLASQADWRLIRRTTAAALYETSHPKGGLDRRDSAAYRAAFCVDSAVWETFCGLLLPTDARPSKPVLTLLRD